MAKSTFSADQPPIDGPVERLIELNPGRPLKLRVQPDIYDHGESRYQSWAGLTWIVECTDLEEARRLREGLTNFFRLFGNPEAQGQILNVLDMAVKVWEKAGVGTGRADLVKEQLDGLALGPGDQEV